MTLHRQSRLSLLTALPLLLIIVLPGAFASVDTLRIEGEPKGKRIDLSALLGTNLALWYEPEYLGTDEFQEFLKEWGPGLIRLPGGSWSNEYYWNGNGVRDGEVFNREAFQDGKWQVDYSAYAPGFRIHGTSQELSDYHGVIDVRRQHELAESMGAKQMVTVNVGTGTPQMAVEWLTWADSNNYSVPYWEIGNELNGQWEVGHFLPDGTGMTGEIYAERFLEYARALKAVNPAIKVGGPASSDLSLAFVEELIRDAGEELDFISFHAYPVGVQRADTEGKFTDIQLLREALQHIRQWKQTYQPERMDAIEIGITEWNMKVNEDRDTGDLINGLWSAVWIGTMVEGGVTFANQWDLLTATAEGGHGAFHVGRNGIVPKSIYWAHYIWANLMGDRVVPSTMNNSGTVASFVTQSDTGWQIMLVNWSESETQEICIELPATRAFTRTGRLATFSHREYFWNPVSHQPLWSCPPSVVEWTMPGDGMVTVPPFSLQVVEIPFEDEAARLQETPPSQGRMALNLLVPENAPADLPLEAWVYVTDNAGNPHDGDAEPVVLSFTGPVEETSLTVSLSRSVARCFVNPTASGQLKLTARSGDLKAQAVVDLIAVASRPVIHWTFDNPISEWGASGTFTIGMEPSVKPNEFVAETILENAMPGDNADVLLLLESMPEKLPKARIGGIIGEMQASPDFKSDDPDARVNIVMQSEADHWMVVGSIRLEDMRGRWEHFRFEISDPRRLKAMARLYGVRYQLESQAPVTGRIYFDNLGFLLRASD
ncbi:MAG: hypothetical protein AB3N64_10705 [Puniceicoccaceae bacterium]